MLCTEDTQVWRVQDNASCQSDVHLLLCLLTTLYLSVINSTESWLKSHSCHCVAVLLNESIYNLNYLNPLKCSVMGSQIRLQSSCRFFSFFPLLSVLHSRLLEKHAFCQLRSRLLSVYSWLREALKAWVSHHVINYSRHSKEYINLEKVKGFWKNNAYFCFIKPDVWR